MIRNSDVGTCWLALLLHPKKNPPPRRGIENVVGVGSALLLTNRDRDENGLVQAAATVVVVRISQ